MRKLKTNELNRLSLDAYRKKPKQPVILILDNIRSGSNVGSAFRSGDAFAIEAIYLCGITATPPHREILKTALGATESVQWSYFEQIEEAIQQAKAKTYQIFAVEQTDDSTFLADLTINESTRGIGLIFGNEVKGVSDEALALVDGAIEIQQFGTKHSLNISVSVGIVLWQLIRQIG